MEESAKRERYEFRKSLAEWVKTNCPNWTSEPSVTDWLAEISSETTRKNIVWNFPMFLGFVKMSPTEIYEKRIRDLKSEDPKVRSYFERMVIRFKNALAEHHYSHNSIRQSYINRVQSFFKHSYIPLSFPKGALRVELSDEVKRTRRTKQPPTNKDVGLMYRIADIEDRVMLLLLYQYGMATVDVSMLRIEQMPISEGTPEDDFVYLELWREKTDVPVRTALNPEIIADYKALIQRRGWPSEGWVFESRMGNRLREDYIRERMKSLAIKALPSEKAERFKCKDLRDSFNQALLESRITKELKDCLFGHKREGARAHYAVSIRAVVDAYKTAFKFVSVNGGGVRRIDLENLGKIVDAIAGAMLASNPTPEFIKLIEDAYGLRRGTIAAMLTGQWTVGDLIRRLRER